MAKRRGHGEGSIYQRKDGRWAGAVEMGWQDGKRRRKTVYGRTRREVADKVREVQQQIEQGIPIPPERLTVAQWLSRWLQTGLSQSASPNTVANYQWVIERHLIPALGPIRLKSLTPSDVDTMLKAKAAGGLSPSSCMRMRSVLRMALHQAESEGLIHRNVATLTKTPALTHAKGRALTVQQAKALLEATKDSRLEAALLTMLLMGLRPGEATGLTWTAIDLDSGVLHVEKALLREPSGLRLGPPKTPKSRRSLAMPSAVQAALRRRRAQQAKERLRSGLGTPTDDLVFTTTAGTPIDPSNLRRDFTALVERAELPGHWTPKDLRHSAVTLLSAAGVPLERIADVAGHDGTRMTGGVYRHLLNPVVDHAVGPMEDLFADPTYDEPTAPIS